MSLLLILLLPALQAAEYRVVRLGDSVESIAQQLGEPELAADIRSLNQLGGDAQPAIGSLIELPVRPGPPLVEQEGAVLHAQGEVTVRRAGQEPAPATAGLELPQGSTVCTGPESFATLRLARSSGSLDHDDVNLLAETCLTLVSATSRATERSSVLRVESGSIAIRAADELPGTVVVETESGITTGSGGGFRVSREADATRTEALTAPVAVLGAGQEVAVGAGQGSRTVTGEAPSPPVDLLLATVPQRPQINQPLRRPDFGWTEVDGALGYRVEIASSADFAQLVLVDSVPETSWAPQLLFLPIRVEGLWWRVAAFDRVGFLGFPSEPRELLLPTGVGP
jgi:hypothetical protein